ncbi:MAG: tRNA (adenosine(37)-N6)-threonylcarbamoyltransferase complex dimerization subunit type 1 TsaB [Candidatus Doudnabacteria bacterium]
MLLFIDTTDQDSAKLTLISNSKTIDHIFKVSHNLSEVLIGQIQTFLKKQKIKFADLDKIAVVTGPGHFSKIRTAVAAANALAYGLGIPVVSISAGLKIDWQQLAKQKGKRMTQPQYGREPNITLPKKRS